MTDKDSGDDDSLVRVLAVGSGGERAVGKMEGRICGVSSCGTVEELVSDSGRVTVGGDLTFSQGVFEELDPLQVALEGSLIVFVVSFLEDESVGAAMEKLGRAAREAGALAVAVTAAVAAPWVPLDSFDARIVVTADCIYPGDEMIPVIFGINSLLDYLLRHAVEQVATMATERGLICIDYADIKAILTGGGDTFMGIGLAGGDGKGSTAANALRGLAAQHLEVTKASGLLAKVMGSSNMTMEDFDAASQVIHDAVPEDRDVICGCGFDDALGDNMKVTVLANFGTTHQRWTSSLCL